MAVAIPATQHLILVIRLSPLKKTPFKNNRSSGSDRDIWQAYTIVTVTYSQRRRTVTGPGTSRRGLNRPQAWHTLGVVLLRWLCPSFSSTSLPQRQLICASGKFDCLKIPLLCLVFPWYASGSIVNLSLDYPLPVFHLQRFNRTALCNDNHIVPLETMSLRRFSIILPIYLCSISAMIENPGCTSCVPYPASFPPWTPTHASR
jgi:hypothetical protein